jgi:putative ABC transport system permease protein
MDGEFELEKAIREWRLGLRANEALEDGYVSELESHLRDEISRLAGAGLGPEDAFREAARSLGRPDALAAEYARADVRGGPFPFPPPQSRRLMPAFFWSAVKVAVRRAKREKGAALLTIAGLAVGFACALLIGIYVVHELSYDRFHSRAGRIQRLRADFLISGKTLDIPKVSPPFAVYLKNEVPEVENVVRFMKMPRTSVKARDVHDYEDGVFYADDAVFSVFSFPLIEGDPRTALRDRNTIVLTERAAAKYFGPEDPMGRTLRFDGRTDYVVTGIMANVPSNSHFAFDMLCSFETFAAANPKMMANWISLNFYTYVLLREGADRDRLAAKFPGLVEAKVGGLLKAIKADLAISLQPLTSIHLRSHLKQEIAPTGDIMTVSVLAGVGWIILLIAAINFMNLSTARYSTRVREVGVRKVIGAHRGGLVRQFLCESLVLSLIAAAAALALKEVFWPLFKSLSGIEPSGAVSRIIPQAAALVVLASVVGLGAGIYPALFLSSFRPIHLLQDKGMEERAGHSRFRNVLVLVQFTVSIALMAATGVALSQLSFMKRKALGFDKERVVVLPLRGGGLAGSSGAVKERLGRFNGIAGVAVSSQVPGDPLYFNPYLPEGFAIDEMQYMGELEFDEDVIPTLGMELAAGRNFRGEAEGRPTRDVIINEAAVRAFGWDDDDPLGKQIRPIEIRGPGEPFVVVGVVKDFHAESLHRPIEPLLITYSPEGYGALSVKIRPGKVGEVMGFLRAEWAGIDPGRPFEYAFLDETFDALYRSDERIGRIFGVFTGLAIFVACLGLFGLASFTAERRTKEIGVRKVLGASVLEIVRLVTWDLLKWVAVAGLIACPAAYFLTVLWLRNYAYRIEPGAWLFAGAAIAALAVAAATVSRQTWRAATADPVRSLRYE